MSRTFWLCFNTLWQALNSISWSIFACLVLRYHQHLSTHGWIAKMWTALICQNTWKKKVDVINMLYKTSSESKGFKTKQHICAVQCILQVQQQYIRIAANCEQLHHSGSSTIVHALYSKSSPFGRQTHRSIDHGFAPNHHWRPDHRILYAVLA